MILRRITQHVKDQNWTAIAIDFVIVVVGVVMGFQVTAWGGERADRAREQVLIRGLQEDFLANRARYDEVAAVRDLRVRRLRNLHAMTGPDAPEPNPARFDSLLQSSIDWLDFDPTVGRVDALLGSGQIALVRSDSLQAALASWPTVLANMEENERMAADIVTGRMLPYLASRYPLVVVDASAGLVEPARPNAFPIDRRALLTDLTFANLVEDRWAQSTLAIRDGEPVRELIEALLRLLDAETQR
ncbi:hypothetical protein [Rubrivirga sp. IMCC43871]|uniref:hypothetical protein n=1 Tax=Rubrivirga sp. IMCC43871 TaxID=3391575 RepID=UPI0039901699